MAHVVQMFLQKFGIRHRVSSAYFAHSNSRAELAVKSAKRMLRDNMSANGQLNNNNLMAAILQFRNTPLQDCRRSPAQMVFGRHMRDLLPAVKQKYEPMKDYFMSHELRERMLAKRREYDGERLVRGARQFEQLLEGTEVLIQNQTGPNPTKWDKSGVILENRPHSQVLIKVHGSNRLTLRNRRFIKPLYPAKVLNEQHGPFLKVKKSPPPVKSADSSPSSFEPFQDRLTSI